MYHLQMGLFIKKYKSIIWDLQYANLDMKMYHNRKNISKL